MSIEAYYLIIINDLTTDMSIKGLFFENLVILEIDHFSNV